MRRNHHLFLAASLSLVLFIGTAETMAQSLSESTQPQHSSIHSRGGPDTFGYRYVDNLLPDTATYEWIELRGESDVNWISFGNANDAVSEPIELPFQFPFYGAYYPAMRISTNGNIQFNTANTHYINSCLPFTPLNAPMIMPWFDDLELTYGGVTDSNQVVGVKFFGSEYVVIEFDSIGHFDGASSYKFEVILYANGRIKLQYNNMIGQLDDATIGIQADNNGPVLEYRCFSLGPLMESGRVVWIFGPSGQVHDFTCYAVNGPIAGRVSPLQSINVVAQFSNYGLDPEASPVSYRFNGGPIQTENSPVLQPGEITQVGFANEFVVPNQNGRYLLEVWSDLSTDGDRGNDTVHVSLHVGCEDFVVNAPGEWGAETCYEGADCAIRTGTEVIYAVQIPSDGYWTLSTCDTRTNFNTHLTLLSACCGGSLIAQNDNRCRVTGRTETSTIPSQFLMAGTYYAHIEGFTGVNCGYAVLSVRPGPPCVPCQGADVFEFVENPADTSFYRTDPNGGCNSQPPAFQPVQIGQTVCGLSFFYNGTNADTDWYLFDVASEGPYSIEMWSDFLAVGRLWSMTNCDSIQSLAEFSIGAECEHSGITVNLSPGEYILYVTPRTDQESFTINQLRRYRMMVYAGPLAIGETPVSLAEDFEMLPAFPNPFNPQTTIPYRLNRSGRVSIVVYDLQGRVVRELQHGLQAAGEYEVSFEAGDFASGIYFVRLSTPVETKTQKLLLLK